VILDTLGNAIGEREAFLKTIEEKIASEGDRDQTKARIVRYLHAAKAALYKPLTIGIVGEINTGKTELANLILGIQVLPSSVINNTLSPTVIRYGEFPCLQHHALPVQSERRDASELHRLVQMRSHCVECFLPLPLLKHVEVIDFPAFENADFGADHRFSLLGRTDILIWCTSSARAWTASEKAAWTVLLERSKRSCLFALTHADKLTADALAEVLARLRGEVSGCEIEPLPIAITLAIESRNPRGQIVNGELWAKSGGERFIGALVDALKAKERARRQRIGETIERFLDRRRTAGFQSGYASLNDEWARLAGFFDAEAGEESARAAIGAIAEFRRTVCEPWLHAQNRSGPEIDRFLLFLPDKPEALLSPLPGQERTQLPLIYQQLSCEIQEYTAGLHLRL
jgi:hypothetical protein